MKNINELSLKDLMQMAQDIEEFQNEFSMLMELINEDELKTILKVEKED